MSKLEKSSSNKLYLSIVQGSLRQSVPEGTPDAVRREWEAGGEKGVKYEIVSKAATGRIVEVNFYDGEKGGRKFSTLNIVLDESDDGKQPVIATSVASRYAQDLMKKLPEIDFEQEIRIRPFAFTPEGEDKTITGVEITQPDKAGNFTKFSPKVGSYFHFQDGAGKWKSKNGFPVPDGDTSEYTSDDWDGYYRQVRRFLINYTKENICPRFSKDAARPASAATTETSTAVEYPQTDINPDDIPF